MGLLALKKAVECAQIESEKLYTFLNRYKSDGSSINQERMELIRDIEILYKATKEHATIDTYAKKLFLTKQITEFVRLKNVLSVYLLWAQLVGKVDQRYDTFLANILQMDLHLPKDVSVISWNYDSQFEIAYRSYRQNGSLHIYEKNRETEYPQYSETGKIFKVNGSANLGDFNFIDTIIKEETIPPIIQLIDYYKNLSVDTSGLGFHFKSHLSFAWESSIKHNQLMNEIKQTTKDTVSIVVIGYSFPFFNREIDREIFENMPNLQKIYIQDPYPEAVEPSLKAVLNPECKAIIEYQKNCVQFYLPKEL